MRTYPVLIQALWITRHPSAKHQTCLWSQHCSKLVSNTCFNHVKSHHYLIFMIQPPVSFPAHLSQTMPHPSNGRRVSLKEAQILCQAQRKKLKQDVSQDWDPDLEQVYGIVWSKQKLPGKFVIGPAETRSTDWGWRRIEGLLSAWTWPKCAQDVWQNQNAWHVGHGLAAQHAGVK